MKEVNELCLTFMRSVLERETALHLYALACKYNFETFKKECLQKIVFLMLEFISSHEHFSELNMEDRYEILSQKAKTVENAFLYNKCTAKRVLGGRQSSGLSFGSYSLATGDSYKTNLMNSLDGGKTFQLCLLCQENVKKQVQFY